MSSWPFWNQASTTDWFAVIVVAVEVWDREVRAKVVRARGFMVVEFLVVYGVLELFWRGFGGFLSCFELF